MVQLVYYVVPLGVLNMRSIPVNRHKAKGLGFLSEIIPIVAWVPAPTGEAALAPEFREGVGLGGVDDGHEVNGQSELVGGLVRTGFRNTFGDEVLLPAGTAERLKDFEDGLRLAGLMGLHQTLVQSFSNPTKFRVQKRRVPVDGHVISLPCLSGLALPPRPVSAGRVRRRRRF